MEGSFGQLRLSPLVSGRMAMPKLRLWHATSYGVKRSSVGNVAPMVQKLFVLNFHEMTNENATCGSHQAKDTEEMMWHKWHWLMFGPKV